MQPYASPNLSGTSVVAEPVRDSSLADNERLGALLKATVLARPELLPDIARGRTPPATTTLGDWLGPLAATLKGQELRKAITQRLLRAIAMIDDLLNSQVNAILHHPSFQKLEASWTSLHYLVEQVPEGANIKVKLLNASWKELTAQLDPADPEQSHLFRKVYDQEFGMAGGEPFGLLLGDYEMRAPTVTPQDVLALRGIAQIAAAAFAPFITAAHPSLFDLNQFAELERPLDLAQTFTRLDFREWQQLRRMEDSRFVGLTMPRVLARLPYSDDPCRVDGFHFQEDVEGPDRSKYLWGNASYAFATVLIRAFAQSGSFLDIRGAGREGVSGGMVTGLPVQNFNTDKRGIALKCSTDAVIPDAQEKELAGLGFIPLCPCPGTEWSAFHSNQSVQEAERYDREAANLNALISTKLQYILICSRFAHCLKVMGRNLVGTNISAAELQDRLRKWLMDYTTAATSPTPEQMARHPLRESKVIVENVPGAPGSFRCQLHLRPHSQTDQMVSALVFTTELSAPNAAI